MPLVGAGAGVGVSEQVIFMNDITEVGEKMVRPHEPLLNNLPVESSVYELYVWSLSLCQPQFIRIHI